ncbi:MAG TPA: FtsX-like permease family protein [Streptosporangiaceae bacterium]|nr:FtsX-like permease family protein [Streptosporangiaceae bacterium]
MLRLSARLAISGGREGRTRLIVTAVAVAIGVAILLAVLADFHAFQVTNNRPTWENTTAASSPSPDRTELWNYSNDIYHGTTIERLDVAALGSHAPVLPGLSRMPGPGQYYASPAMAALLRTAPRDQLGDRFPGKLAGTIGQQALTGPDELVIVIGYRTDALTALPSTIHIDSIATTAGKQIWSPYFRVAFIGGAIAFVFPILILIGTATRLAAARREERYAALRLCGATSRQISVIAAVDSLLSALLGSLAGIGIFLLLRPALANTAITSQRYFANEVTPTIAGYAAVLVIVPIAAAVTGLLSLRRVRVSPLGVSRKVTPPPPSMWRTLPLVVGLALFVAGLAMTSRQSIGGPAIPGLLVVLVGLVIAGPWLTGKAARIVPKLMSGASPVLAARRLGDNPKAAFRSVSGLVLAVFLGTMVAALLPAIQATTATPTATALSNVLLDGFTLSPICGNSVNCTGSTQPGYGLQNGTGAKQRIAAQGLPPAAGATVLAGLNQIGGARAVAIYSLPGTGSTAGPPQFSSVVPCSGLRLLPAFGTCARGVTAVHANTFSLFGDNPMYTTQPFVTSQNPAARGGYAGLYLQAVLVKVDSQATLERVRTYLVTHTPLTASGMAPRTFGEAVQVREGVATTVQRLIDIAVALTLIVAGCSLAVAAGGGVVERKRPFTLLRLSGTPVGTLYRVVMLEAVAPLVAATAIAAGLAYGMSVLTVAKLGPAGSPTPVLDHAYYLIMGLGLVGALAVLVSTLPVLSRVSSPGNVRFE